MYSLHVCSMQNINIRTLITKTSRGLNTNMFCGVRGRILSPKAVNHVDHEIDLVFNHETIYLGVESFGEPSLSKKICVNRRRKRY